MYFELDVAKKQRRCYCCSKAIQKGDNMQLKEITYEEKANISRASSVLISMVAIINEDEKWEKIFDQLKSAVKDKLAERLSENEAMADVEGPATQKQIAYIKRLAKGHSLEWEDLEVKWGPIDTVSRASEVIDALMSSSI